MIEALVKYVYKFHKDKVMELVIADYLGAIPNRVTDDAVVILQEKRVRVEKWIAYQSYVLQRRMVNDPKNGSVLYGMMIQLKLMNHMISAGHQTVPEEAEGTSPASVAEEQRKKREAEDKELEAAIAGAQKFAGGAR